MSVWYFAYGSNMEAATFRGRRGIAPRRAIGACAAGWRIVFDKPPLVPIGESFANIVVDRATEAFGVLYEIDEADLEHIELTEGVKIGNYDRVRLAVRSLANPAESVAAFALATHAADPSLRPSTRYMALVIAGALEHGLPEHYLEWLRAVPTCAPSEESLRLRAGLDEAFRLLRK